MKRLQENQTFVDYMKDLRDKRAYKQITDRIDRLCAGNAGDHKPIGEHLKELRIHTGKGYRVYYVDTDHAIIVLWAGHKGTQVRDIKKAQELLEEGKKEWHLN